ncbi:tellurite resistance TerB family protein [Paraburkholderia sp. FT54]|jgi:tellurite resistance protein|uniref:tellurite resistance TerB family protein n=1 Tax=Paraburkholderia sp. FT54 TaxID=3074437 RepID=UPI0028778C44|nr:tellurite resistance TerB family protein [Paraburkholderia sp. FT54]WNC93726.1 tellurite resistance TerB family protein [Paraburkholderia sp. FT54]
MRTYPRNSPQAAARIVALALTADGHVCSSEERVLQRLNIAGELGLAPAQFEQIVQTLCEDHLVAHLSSAPPVGHLDPAMLTTLIDEIDDPELRRKVIRLCVAVAVADDHLADGEISLLAAILNAWGPNLTPVTNRHGLPSRVVRGYQRAPATT